MTQSPSDNREAYHELLYYTLAHPDPKFIHQYAVDAYAAQHADEKSKRIGVAFALIGLYLALKKGYSGREVQLAHMELGKKRKMWPAFDLPKSRGTVTVADVMSAAPGAERDAAIRNWCASVWKAYGDSHDQVAALVRGELGV
ncbi:MAG: hypothetical protein KGI60_00805 [Patescibacteria group bacterium]|nr:hypothetical protein [Patescibacteria group bacterium]